MLKFVVKNPGTTAASTTKSRPRNYRGWDSDSLDEENCTVCRIRRRSLSNSRRGHRSRTKMADTGHAESFELGDALKGHSLKNPANVRATVAYDFEPDERNEIKVIRGQNVRIMHEENGWAFVRVESGKVGFIPLRYCVKPQVRRLASSGNLRRTRSKSPQSQESGAKPRSRSANDLRRSRKLSGSCPGLSDFTESDSDYRHNGVVSSSTTTSDTSHKGRYSSHCQSEAKLLKTIERRLKGNSSVHLKKKIAALLSEPGANKTNNTVSDKTVNCGRLDRSAKHDPAKSKTELEHSSPGSRMSVDTSMESLASCPGLNSPNSPTGSTMTDSDYGTSIESDTDSSFGSVQMGAWKRKMLAQKQLIIVNRVAETARDCQGKDIENLEVNSKVPTDNEKLSNSVNKGARAKRELTKVNRTLESGVSKFPEHNACNSLAVKDDISYSDCSSQKYDTKEGAPNLCSTIRQLEDLIKQSCFGDEDECSYGECHSEGYGSDSSDSAERSPQTSGKRPTKPEGRPREGHKSTHPFQKSDKETLLVLFDFIATEENDLTVRQGETVTLLNHDDYDWCFVRNLHGKEGFIPFSYAVSQEVYKGKMICETRQRDGNKLNQKTRSTTRRQVISGNRGNGMQENRTQRCHTLDESDYDVTELTTRTSVTHNHKALTASELTVRRGDTVYFNRNDFEESCVWVLVFSPDREARGYVPKVYLAWKMEDLV